MKISENFKNELLRERKSESLLKNYLDEKSNIFGEEYVVQLLSSEEDIKEAINSESFKNLTSNQIIFSLLRIAILSNEKNHITHAVELLIKERKIDDLIEGVKSNYQLRKGLTRIAINESLRFNNQLFERNENKTKALAELAILSKYEKRIIKEKEQQFKKKKKYIYD